MQGLCKPGLGGLALTSRYFQPMIRQLRPWLQVATVWKCGTSIGCLFRHFSFERNHAGQVLGASADLQVCCKRRPCVAIGKAALGRARLLPSDLWMRKAEYVRDVTARAAPAAAAATAAVPFSIPTFTDGWPLWTLLLTCAAVGQLADSRSRIGGLLGGPLVSMLCAVCLACCGIIPTDTPAYDVVWSYLMPLAAGCFLLDADMGRLIRTGGPVLAAFLIGGVGMVLGAVAGCAVLRAQLGAQASCVAAALCSSYVGGSINFVAVAQAVGLDPALVPAAMAADNLAMAGYLAILMAVPTKKVESFSSPSPAASTSSGTLLSSSSETAQAEPAAPAVEVATSGSIVLCLACAAASNALARVMVAGLPALKPLVLTIMVLIAIALSSLTRWLLRTGPSEPHRGPGGVLVNASPSPFAGAAQLGGALMLVFFAVIGASAGGLQQLPTCGSMITFLTVMVVVHWAVLATAGSLLGLPREAMLLGSNANIGGPATAASMALSKGWGSMAQTAMLVGSLGYAVGTAAGMAVAKLTTVF